jgi:DNA-binding NtrC family response regulator
MTRRPVRIGRVFCGLAGAETAPQRRFCPLTELLSHFAIPWKLMIKITKSFRDFPETGYDPEHPPTGLPAPHILQKAMATDAELEAMPAPFRRLGGRVNRCPRLDSNAPIMRRLEEAIARVADFECPVLITGETGCGKEEIARAIHASGPRRDKPFVPINCGGLVATIAESQLFGHEKGAFTGANGVSLGGFRAADGGVLFLDEIGEMPLELQPKLLRVLQRGDVTPVGSTLDHHVDVQVIAATNRDLEAEVDAGTFRKDLLYRLNTVHLDVPPLRARPEDIPRFIHHFAAHFAREYGVARWQPDEDLMGRLATLSWPGNVRQLAQTVQRVYIFGDRVEQVLADLFAADKNDLSDSDAGEPLSAPLSDEPIVPVFNLDELRRLAVRQALAKTDGHRGQAAELLGISLSTMTRLALECCPEMAAKVGRRLVNRPR